MKFMFRLLSILNNFSQAYWTLKLKLKLRLIGAEYGNITALGPVRIRGFEKGGKLSLGENVILHPWCDLKFRGPSIIRIGDNVVLDFGVRIVAAMGFHCLIHRDAQVGYCTIVNAGENIEIGERTVLGGNCLLQASEHKLSEQGLKGIYSHEYVRGPIKLGAGSWLAANVIVRPGVAIGSSVIIGANSIVKSSCEQPGVYAGSPDVRRIGDLS